MLPQDQNESVRRYGCGATRAARHQRFPRSDCYGNGAAQMFVPPEDRSAAYADRALVLDRGQTISQPYIVALMTEALQLSGRESVLEIGTGSGYQTAILCELRNRS